VTLNIDKTNYIMFCSRGKQQDHNIIKIEMPGIEIRRVSFVKKFGVIIDDRLSWKIHIDSVCKKVSKSIGILRSYPINCHSQLSYLFTTV